MGMRAFRRVRGAGTPQGMRAWHTPSVSITRSRTLEEAEVEAVQARMNGRGGRTLRRPIEREMSETTVMQTDLDLLAERVEKAAALVQRLKEDRQRLERERGRACEQAPGYGAPTQGQDLGRDGELQTLRKSQRPVGGERRDVASPHRVAGEEAGAARSLMFGRASAPLKPPAVKSQAVLNLMQGDRGEAGGGMARRTS